MKKKVRYYASDILQFLAKLAWETDIKDIDNKNIEDLLYVLRPYWMNDPLHWHLSRSIEYSYPTVKYQKFSKLFRSARLNAGYDSVPELANILVCTPAYIYGIENDTVIPSNEILSKCERLFDIEKNTLVNSCGKVLLSKKLFSKLQTNLKLLKFVELVAQGKVDPVKLDIALNFLLDVSPTLTPEELSEKRIDQSFDE